MEWITVLGLVFFGIILLVVEIIFVPGTTVVGIIGLIFCVYGIYLGYDYFDASTGTLILLGTLMGTVAALVLSFKGRSWERFSLKGSIKGTFNEDFKMDLKVGDVGQTISSLKPIGKALFNDQEVEVRSNGDFIKENVPVEILRIESTKIFVKPVNH